MSETSDLIEAGDVDGLLRRIDDLVDAGSWPDLAKLCSSCRAAVERGKQLWPVALHGEYRLALGAPAQWAGPAVVAGHGVFGLGPLTEVAAVGHSWTELRDHLPAGPERALTAHERVVRGEVVDPDDIDPAVIAIPTRLANWEPRYPVAEYEPHRATFPGPTLPTPTLELTGTARASIGDEAVEALLALTAHWTDSSTGRADALMVEGDAADAVATLGLDRVAAAEVEPATALALMAWAGASGGAHGRRRGMAAGRFEAWWGLAALTGLDEPWPPHAEDLGFAAADLRWYVWRPRLPESGWSLHLAVEDPAAGLAWALSAVDAG